MSILATGAGMRMRGPALSLVKADELLQERRVVLKGLRVTTAATSSYKIGAAFAHWCHLRELERGDSMLACSLSYWCLLTT